MSSSAAFVVPNKRMHSPGARLNRDGHFHRAVNGWAVDLQRFRQSAGSVHLGRVAMQEVTDDTR